MSKSCVHIALVGSDSERSPLLQRILAGSESSSVDLTFTHASSIEGIKRLGSDGVDAVLLDLSTEGLRGLNLIEELRESAPAIPIVVIGKDGNEFLGEKVLQAGARGFLTEASFKDISPERIAGPQPVKETGHADSRATVSGTSESGAPARDPDDAPVDSDNSDRPPPTAEPQATEPQDKKPSAFRPLKPDEILGEPNVTRILIVEDNPGDVFLIKKALEEYREEKYEIDTATRLTEALALLGDRDFDVILLDLILPDSSGLRTFFKVRNTAKGTAIIPMAALDDRHLGTSILKEGAQDFLLKGDINSDELARSIRYSRERNRVEREIEEAREVAVKASRAKSDFLASMSHEIRTPMNSILGMAELLLESDLDTEQRRYVQTLDNAGEALMALINDVLDLSKIEADKVELEIGFFDLYELVEKTTTLHAAKAQEKGLVLVCDIAADVPRHIGGDQNRVRQILINLLGNAIKFTEKGEVLLRVERVDTTADTVSLRFSVTDTGAGIPTDRLKSIFEAFSQADSSVTRKYGGTGLGLTISRRLALLMGGDLWAESTLGEGSRFFFTASFKPGTTQNVPPGLFSKMKDISALILMENATERGAVKDFLESWNVGVFETGDEDPAIDELWRAQSSKRAYNLVFLDAGKKTRGLDVASGIRDEPDLTAIPVLLLDSVEAQDEMRKYEKLGFPYVVKPILQSELLRVVNKIFGMESAEEVATRPRIGRLPPLRILLVDDSEDNRLLILSFFKKTPFQIAIAENGKQALDKLYGRKYDLVLMDMQMPVMDGYTAVRNLRQWEKERDVSRTPIIALTAQAFQEDEQRSLDAGCDSYLVKPIKKQKLLEAILEWADTSDTESREGVADWYDIECIPERRRKEKRQEMDAKPAQQAKPAQPAQQVKPVKPVKPAQQAKLAKPIVATKKVEDEDDDVQALAPGYLRNRWQDVTTIETALKVSDFSTIKRLGHNMKGTGTGYGFEGLSRIGSSIEQAAKASDAVTLRDLVKALEVYLRDTEVGRPSPERDDTGKRKRIVIVDDDRDYLNLMTVKLTKKGFEVEWAEDGQSALKKIRDEQPSVILLDLGLPAGDGFKVIERLKTLTPTAHIPVITVSGSDSPDDKEKALAYGALAYIQKPVEISKLVEEIERVT